MKIADGLDSNHARIFGIRINHSDTTTVPFKILFWQNFAMAKNPLTFIMFLQKLETWLFVVMLTSARPNNCSSDEAYIHTLMHIQTRMDKRVILRQKQHIGWYADFNLQFHIIFDFSVDDDAISMIIWQWDPMKYI